MLRELFKKYNMAVTGVIEIGAHYGDEDALYNEFGIKHKIYFEPIKQTFDKLIGNIDQSSIAYNCALGNENKEVDMFVESDNFGQSCSVLVPSLHVRQYPEIKFTGTERVQMYRLDDIDVPKTNINMLKIDVQGYELEVLKGGKELLKQIDYIYCEVNRAELYANCPMVEDIINYLEPFGFRMVEVYWMGNTWGDALFIKNEYFI